MPKKFETREELLIYQRAATARYKKKHPEKVKAQKRAAYHADIEKSRMQCRGYMQKWREENPERNLITKQNRRAKERTGKLSGDIVAKLMDRQKCQCACCRVSIKKERHIDHIMPLAKGGTNTDDNIQLLCPSCNWSKGAKHPVDFMQSRGFLL